MKIKNILIIGGAGQLGDNLFDHLRSKYKIFVVDKKKLSDKKKKNYLKCDLLARKNIHRIPKKIDIAFFLVGMVGGPSSMELNNFKDYVKKNCETLLNYLNQIKKSNLKKIIFMSTEHVYGDNDYQSNHLSGNEPKPKNYYGLSKILAEKILYKFYKENKISVDVLRFPRVISKNNLNLIEQLKRIIISKKKIFIQNPKLNFNFIYINDFLSACERCAKQQKKGYRILNIFNSSDPISIKKIIEIIKKRFDKNAVIKLNNKNLGSIHNPVNLKISNRSTCEALKWKPKYNNKEIIYKIINNNET